MADKMEWEDYCKQAYPDISFDWSYADIFEMRGKRILDTTYFGAYQGTLYLETEDGLYDIAYGSCSGCDAYEATFALGESTPERWEEVIDSFFKMYEPMTPDEIDRRINSLDADTSWDMDAKAELDFLKSYRQGVL